MKHNYSVDAFWNRSQELSQIKQRAGRPGFGYVTGRRRVGKTALLKKAVDALGGIYHQAVEGTPQQQLLHVAEELKDPLAIFRDVTPRSWAEFFRLLSREKLPKLLVLDEFPYWAAGDPSLPSLFQKWIDHELPKQRTLVLVSGSSQSMLHSQFLNPSAPLYGRASLHLHLNPMGYTWFCRALGYEPGNPETFARFTLVGGVPHYWKLMPKGSWVGQADRLYFQPSGVLAEEPTHLIREEGISGTLPKAILDLVGRGVTKPSELASRLGIPQGNLSRPLAMLLDLGLVQREFPFGESSRTTKRVLYQIQDPALAFFYGIYLPSRSRWEVLPLEDKKGILTQHVSRQWEKFCRQIHPGAARYWEADAEIDFVWHDPSRRVTVVAECKWSRLTPAKERELLGELRSRFLRTRLSRKLKRVQFRLMTPKDLPHLAQKG